MPTKTATYQGLTSKEGKALKCQWKKWLYDDELERVEKIEKYLLELEHDHRLLMAERRMLSMRGTNRALWDKRRAEKAKGVAK